jgi:hypothetical protein
MQKGKKAQATVESRVRQTLSTAKEKMARVKAYQRKNGRKHSQAMRQVRASYPEHSKSPYNSITTPKPNLKTGNRLERKFKMTNKHRKRCSMSPAIRKSNQTTMTCCHRPRRMAII